MGDELEEGDLLRVELDFFPHDGMGWIGCVFVRKDVSALRWLLDECLLTPDTEWFEDGLFCVPFPLDGSHC